MVELATLGPLLNYDGTTPPTTGQAPVWDAVAGKWKPGSVASGGSSVTNIPSSLYARVMCDAGSGFFAYAFAEVTFTDETGADISASGATAIESSHQGTQTASLAFDGNASTFWAAGNSGAQTQTQPQWVGLQFTAAKKVLGYKLTARNGGSSAELQAPLQHGLEVSNDGVRWTRVASFANTDFGVGAQRTFASPSTAIAGTVITPTWKGARLQLVSAVSRTSGDFTALPTWPTPLADTNSFWSSGAPGRFTIPAGVSRVRMVAKAVWASNSTGSRWAFIRKNGSADLAEGGGEIKLATVESTTTVISGVVPVVAGDYFEVLFTQTSGGALNLVSPTYFEIEVVEGSILNQAVGPATGTPYTACGDTFTSSASTSLFAMKGNVLQARQAAYMDGVTVMLAPAAAAEVYKIVIYEITSGKVIISKVSESSTFTTTAAGAICPFFKFTAPAAIVSGSYYAIVLVRTDGTTTTSANVHFPGIAVVAPWDGFVFVDNIRYSGSLAPANGATLTNSGSTGFCHMRMAMRAP